MAIKRSVQQLAAELDAATARARVLAESLSVAELNRRPGADRWSVGECLQHLIDTNAAYIAPLEGALRNGRVLSADRTREHSLGWFGSWFAQSLEPPVKRRFKAPKVFEPKKHEVTAAIIDEFVAMQKKMIELLETAAAIDAARVKLSSPASKLIRLPLIAAFAVAASHERRHLWQAEAVVRAISH